AEKNAQLKRVEFLEKFFQIGFKFLLDFWLRLGWLGFAQLHHHLKIFEMLFRLEQRLDAIAERVGFLDEFLGLLPVVPEIFRRHQHVKFAEALLRFRNVKETSANARASRTPSKFLP